MSLDPKRTVAELKELRELTEDANGAQRVAWTDTWLKAREWFRSKLAGLPVEHHHDAAGNGWVTLRGDSEKALLIGGHLDSVPNGGWLDGSLDEMAALEVLRRFSEEYAGRPPVTIRVVDWADEEGARFGRSLLGSSAFAGTHSIAADRVRARQGRHSPRRRSQAVRCGDRPFSRGPTRAAERGRLPGTAYRAGSGAGALGAAARRRAGHQGCGASFVYVSRAGGALGFDSDESAARCAGGGGEISAGNSRDRGKHPDAVSTIGSVKTFPGIVTAVVGRCEAALDQRDLDAEVLAQMFREAREASHRFAAEEKCTVEWSRIWSIEPLKFHPVLLDLCEQAIQETAGRSHRLPSGPLHDAAEVSRAGIPTVMMFVQSLKGISHNKIENTLEEHLELSVIALDRLATKTVEWIRGSS